MINKLKTYLQQKQWLKRSNIFNILFFALVLLILFVPSAKVLVIQGLMQAGLFKPPTGQAATKQAAPEMAFVDQDGHSVTLSSLKGKVVFINFWATWCPPCAAEMPSINELHQQFKGNNNVVFLMVDADTNFAKSVPFMANRNYTLPVFAAAGNLSEAVFKGSLPTTVVIDKQGLLTFRHEGTANYASTEFAAYLNKLATL